MTTDPFAPTPPTAAESAYVAEGAALLTAAAERLELLQGEASPTPWGWTKHRHDSAFGRNDPETGEAQSTIALIYHGPHAADAELIATLVNAGPLLISLLRNAARDAVEVGPDRFAVALARKIVGE